MYKEVDDRAGFWHDRQLSIGRLFEDVLALIVHAKRQIAPLVLAITGGTALVDVYAPQDTGPQGPVMALRDVSFVALHPSGIRIAWYVMSLVFAVALTKVLYAAYYDHEQKNASQLSGFVAGFMRTIGATFLYAVGIAAALVLACLFLIIPLFLLAVIVLFVAVALGGNMGLLLHSPGMVIALSATIQFLALTFVILGGQYVAVAAAVSENNVLQIALEGIRAVLTPRRALRILTIGAIYVLTVCVIVAITSQLTELLARVNDGMNTTIVKDVLDNLLLTPIIFAFGVVFYTDMTKRLMSTAEAGVVETLHETT